MSTLWTVDLPDALLPPSGGHNYNDANIVYNNPVIPYDGGGPGGPGYTVIWTEQVLGQ